MWKRALTTMIVYLTITACINNTSTDTPSLVFSFPQSINTPTVFLEALFKGELILTNGCLRVNDTDGKSILLIWHPGFSTRMHQGIVQVVDSTGQVAASVGDFVSVGEGFDLNPTWYGLAEPLQKSVLALIGLLENRLRKSTDHEILIRWKSCEHKSPVNNRRFVFVALGKEKDEG